MLAALPVVLLFVICATVVAVRGVQNDRVAADQDLFHLPVIRQFAAQWPTPDLSNYASATAPGYHLLLAAVDRSISPDARVLRFVGGLFGVALIAVVATAAARRSAWLTLPLAASVYVLTSTVWLLPENAAWLLVAIALLLAMHANGAALFVGSAITLAALVFVRQSQAWTFAPFAVAAFYSLSQHRGGGFGSGNAAHRFLTAPEPPSATQSVPLTSWRLVLFTTIALLPAIAILATLVTIWHGLTPPAFNPRSPIELPLATKVGGIAPAAAAMVLSLIGLFGTPLLAWLWPAVPARRIAVWAAIGLAVGFLAGVLPQSTYGYEHKSGIWNLVRVLPILADRSPLIVILSMLGGGIAAIALLRLPSRQRSVLAAALVGFTLVQTANVLVWQRYYEPFVLVWLILAAAQPMTMSRGQWNVAVVGLLGLTAFQIGVTSYVLTRGG